MKTLPIYTKSANGGFNRQDGGCAVNCIGPEKCAWERTSSPLPKGETDVIISEEIYRCLHFDGAAIVSVGETIGRIDTKGFHLPTPEGEKIIATHPYFKGYIETNTSPQGRKS